MSFKVDWRRVVADNGDGDGNDDGGQAGALRPI